MRGVDWVVLDDAPVRYCARPWLERPVGLGGNGSCIRRNGASPRLGEIFSSDPVALEETISETAPTLETGIETLPPQRPFLRDLATLARVLRPGVTDLRATLPVLNDALEVGTPVLRESPATNRRLRGVLAEVNRLVSQPSTRLSLQRLAETFEAAKPLARFVVPAQTVCNYWNYWFTFTPNALSDRDQVGYAFRQMLTEFPPGPEVDAPASGYSGEQSNGRAAQALGGTFEPYELPITNAHPYQPTGQTDADCQGGQFGYDLGALPVPGQPLDTRGPGTQALTRIKAGRRGAAGGCGNPRTAARCRPGPRLHTLPSAVP